MTEARGPSDRATTPGEAPRVDDGVAALEARLGLALADRAVALAALTHKSYVNEHRDEAGLADNERLEFLGDAVIDLAVSHRLMERFPDAREGELSKMRAAVVDEQGLSEMARALDLGALLRLGRGEELTGGRGKASLLADAMEAVIAAVYLVAGLPGVLGIIDRFLGEAFARAAAGTLDRDYKTQLQEVAQSRLRATPRYRVVAEHGPDHSKTFEVETDVRGEIVGRGAGRSKKDAEQAAAKLALEVLGRRVAADDGAAAGEGRAPSGEAIGGVTAPPVLSPATAPAPVDELSTSPPAAPTPETPPPSATVEVGAAEEEADPGPPGERPIEPGAIALEASPRRSSARRKPRRAGKPPLPKSGKPATQRSKSGKTATQRSKSAKTATQRSKSAKTATQRSKSAKTATQRSKSGKPGAEKRGAARPRPAAARKGSRVKR
jgi:ribonuclease III